MSLPLVAAAAHTPEEIVMKLREVEKIAATDGVAISVAVKRVGIAESTYDRWRKRSGRCRRTT